MKNIYFKLKMFQVKYGMKVNGLMTLKTNLQKLLKTNSN